jgi:hypothetical protein
LLIIVGIIAFFAVILLPILADRIFSTKWLVIVLCIFGSILGYVHRHDMRALFGSKTPSAKQLPPPTPNAEKPLFEEPAKPSSGELLKPTVAPELPKLSITQTNLTFTFKDSPLFTERRKARIEHNIRKIETYFKAIELDVPDHVPRIGLLTKVDSSGTRASFSPSNYQETLDISLNHIDDPKEITLAYSQFVIWKILIPTNRPPVPQVDEADKRDFSLRVHEYLNRPETIDNSYRSSASAYVPMYLNWSFWNGKGKDQDVPCMLNKATYFVPANFFWAIREKYGQTFADRLVVYTLKEMRDAPHTSASESFDAYFRTRLKQADEVIDNEGSRASEIEQILNDCDWEKKTPARK